jgi:c-di-GMP-binding flagellar brake protein YcgR
MDSTGENIYESERRYLRLDAHIWVRYTVIQRDEMEARIDRYSRSYTQTRNVSGGGILIQPKEKLSVGVLLELEIDLPDEPDAILAIGQVVHVSDVGCGVAFLLIEEADQERLVKYVFAQERLSRQLMGGDERKLDE